MSAELFDADREVERAYWQARLMNLELLLCELLIKNERLRRESETFGSGSLTAEQFRRIPGGTTQPDRMESAQHRQTTQC